MSDQVTAKHISQDEFKATIDAAAGKPVFVDFYAEWCGPCKIASPIIDKLAGEYADKAVIVKVDVDENRELAQQYGVMSIPTVLVFQKKNDQVAVVNQLVGFNGEPKYREMLDQAIV